MLTHCLDWTGGVSNRVALQEIVPRFWSALVLEHSGFLNQSQRSRQFILGMWHHGRRNVYNFVSFCGEWFSYGKGRCFRRVSFVSVWGHVL